ncbi:HNH endonuclease domain protein [marine gamma proteobacterium HTCC2148]|nr:HNH endonuclease domain protein [marine gamma proteobacterium HTCC2148]
MVELEIEVGDEIKNEDLVRMFGCGPQGGMRRSHATNTLVLTSKHVDNVYDDRWVADVFHYTGMGLEGDQSLTYSQNKTLAQSASNGVEVHLFEVFKPKFYTYMGAVELAAEPYVENQKDQNGLERKVYVFPLRPISGGQPTLPFKKIESAIHNKQKMAHKLSDQELLNRAASKSSAGASRSVETKYYERDPWISEYAKRRAGGKCQLCESDAPFISKAGEPYLETHHIEWLANGGEDSISNTVALCPNCHRKMHNIADNNDVVKLKSRNASYE